MVVSKTRAWRRKWITYERNTLSLREEEEDERSTHSRKDTKENVGAIAKMGKHVWSDLTDNEVVHPVRRSTERDSIWSVRHGPDLCNDDPSTWTP